MPPAPIPLDDDHRKQRFLEWLCTPPASRQPHSQDLLAEELGVHSRSLTNWKNNAEFRKAWQKRSTEVIGDPDRAKQVLDALFIAAKDPNHRNHVSAAKLYLEAIDAIKPKKVDVTIQGKEAAKLSDEELDRLIALGAAELKAERHAS